MSDEVVNPIPKCGANNNRTDASTMTEIPKQLHTYIELLSDTLDTVLFVIKEEPQPFGTFHKLNNVIRYTRDIETLLKFTVYGPHRTDEQWRNDTYNALNELADVEQNNRRLSYENRIKHKLIDELKEDNEYLVTKLDNVKKNLKGNMNARNRFARQLEAAQKELSVLKLKRNEPTVDRKELDDLKKNLDETKKNLDEMKKKLVSESEKYAKLQKDHAALAKNNEQLNKKILHIHSCYKGMRRSLNERIEELEDEDDDGYGYRY